MIKCLANDTSLRIALDAYLGMPYKERRKYLRDSWGFNCTCHLCLVDQTTREASDARRMTIVKTRNALTDAQKGRRHREAIEKASDIIKLCEEEGLLPLVAGFYDTIAKEYLEMGDIEDAQVYAELALGGWLEYWGEDSSKVESGLELIATIGKTRPIR